MPSPSAAANRSRRRCSMTIPSQHLKAAAYPTNPCRPTRTPSRSNTANASASFFGSAGFSHRIFLRESVQPRRLKPALLVPFPHGKLGVAFQQPSRYRVVQLRKMPREEVIPTGNDRHLSVFLDVRWKLLDHRAQLIRRTEPIEFPGHQKLRLIAAIEIGEAATVQISDRQF